jgi:hypothetical protein
VRRLFLATLLVSTAAISYEILLMRVLSIVQWHHFAYMIISLALLGYGASGTFIALNKRWLEPRFELAFSISALLFSVTIVVCFIASSGTSPASIWSTSCPSSSPPVVSASPLPAGARL